MLISELLDDHKKALKKKEGEVIDLHRGMEELSSAGKVTTEEISRLKTNLDHEAVVHSSREKTLEQLRGS